MTASHLSPFDYRGYTAEIRPLLEALERDDDGPLRERCRNTIQRTRQRWPAAGSSTLEIHGEYTLLSIAELDERRQEGPLHIGRMLVTVLADYLHAPRITVPGSQFFFGALSALEWTADDVGLVRRGLPNSRLAVADAPPHHVKFVNSETPYWQCLRFDSADSGWLDRDQLQRLLARLTELTAAIESFDIGRLAGVSADDPVVCEQVHGRICAAHAATRRQYSAALENDLGLFVSTITWV